MQVSAHVDEMQLRLATLARAAPGTKHEAASHWTPNLTSAETEAQTKMAFFKEAWPLVELLSIPELLPLINQDRVAEVPWEIMTFSGVPWAGQKPASTPAIQLSVAQVTTGGRSWWVNAKSMFWWMFQVEAGQLTVYKVCGRVIWRSQNRREVHNNHRLAIPQCTVGWELSYPFAERYSQEHWTGAFLNYQACLAVDCFGFVSFSTQTNSPVHKRSRH